MIGFFAIPIRAFVNSRLADAVVCAAGFVEASAESEVLAPSPAPAFGAVNVRMMTANMLNSGTLPTIMSGAMPVSPYILMM